MDQRPIDAVPTPTEVAAIDALLGAPTPDEASSFGLVVAKRKRRFLLPALHAVQDRIGWVSAGALGYICRRLDVPPAEAFGVASFYALFALTEQPQTVLHVCDDIACLAAGAEHVCETLASTGAVAGATWTRSPCLGMCERAPAAMVIRAGDAPRARAFGPVSASDVVTAMQRGSVDDPPRTVLPQAGSASLRLLRRVGRIDPANLDEYRAHDGYAALRRALDLGPTGVIREVTDAKLVGRGGAAFPTGRKWEAVARQPARPHYIVCNADESEPGTFKDRVLMEDDPFAIVEAMTIAASATGCEQGYIYIRGEYPLATERLAHALAQARARGLLGADIMGRGLRFDIELRRGAGAYICGEETALFNSLEGFRGEPRNKPPFPVEVGLFGKPTVVNNVETLANVLDVMLLGASAYTARGTPGSTGTRLFCLAGRIARPGLYEVPFGTRLDALIALAGGVPEGRRATAVLLGGAAGSFVTGADLEVPLTFEDTKRIGASLGSGVVFVLDETVPILPVLRRLAAFFRDESCGQCVPCRVGTVRQEELLARLVAGKPHRSRDDEMHLLREVGQVMRDASICGLGQTASTAIESAIAKGLAT